MAQVSITQLPQAQALTGTESVPIVQNGVTVQTTTGAISGAGALNYPFLTVGSTAGLTDARYLSTGSGLSLTDNGAGSTLQVNLTGAAQSLDSSDNGIQVKTGPNTLTGREIEVGAGLGITNGDGVAGNPTVALGSFLQQLVSLTGTGILALQSGNPAKISILGVTNQISILNGDGASDVTVGLASNPVIPGSAGMTVPIGATGDRPSPSNGIIRYNTTSMAFEGYSNGSWRDFSLAGGVTQIDTGTGLTGGPITTTGTISIANTGVVAGTYGSSTKIPQIIVNAQGQLTSVTEYSVIGGVSSVTGTANEITASPTTGDVVLSLPSALTFTGKTVTGGTFNMDAATVGSDTVTTNTASQTLTNKTISGSNNTLSSIGNSSLTNSSVTYNGVTVSLGSSGTITAVNPYALTIGTGLSGTSYDGAGAVTIAISNTGVTAASYGGSSKTLTATVNAQGQLTALAETSIAISYTQVSGLGTAATLNAGVAGGVATLDGSGQVPLSQLPTAIQGALNYQGVWNASTNTPTLASGVGTKGYFYVVDVAGSTNLDGITSWAVGDWAVFNGTVWQKIDNTDAVTSVNGYTGTVVLSYSDVGAPSTSGTNATGTWGISISGNAATVTNGVYTTGSYADPTWITSLAASKLTGTVAVANGGTNLSSYTVGDLLYASGATTLDKLGIGTNTYILTSSGSAPQWTAPSSVSIGTATNLAGGTAGALPYQTGAGATTFLSLGTTNYVLTAGASAPQYVAQSTLSVGSATNATNVGITTSSTNATHYLTFVSATTGNLPELVNSSITCNPSTGKITDGIAGGSF